MIPTMKNEVAEWTDFFNEVFSEVKKRILKQYKLEEDGSGPPEIIAIRKVCLASPVP